MADSRDRPIDIDSPTWATVCKWAESQISAAQMILETPNTCLEATERERGRIAALRALMKLATRTPYIPPTDAHYHG